MYKIGLNKNGKEIAVVTKKGIKTTGDKVEEKDIGKNWFQLLEMGWVVKEENNIVEEIKENVIDVESEIIDNEETKEIIDNGIVTQIITRKLEKDEYSEMKMKEIREIAKNKNIKFDARTKKTELIDMIKHEKNDKKIIMGAIKKEENDKSDNINSEDLENTSGTGGKEITEN